MSREWIWKCRFYYNDTVKPPKKAGDLAIETIHRTDSSKDIEVAAVRPETTSGRSR